jgi:hypothetical protein
MDKLKYLMVGIIILGASKYLASESPHYTQGKKNAQCIIPSNQTPIDEISPYGNSFRDASIPDISEIISAPREERIEENGNNDGEIEWGTDRLIRSGSSNLRWLSLSHSADMTNKPNYVAIIRYVSGADLDTIFHYYSTDGISWTSWVPIYYPNGDEIWQVEVLVGRGTNPYIYTFTRSTKAGQANSGSLILRRWKADGSTGDWILIAQPGDSIGRFAVDMDENEVLYLAYLKLQSATSWGLYATRSQDQGMTWETPVLVSAGNRKDPEVAIGKGNYFYISYVVNDSIVRIGRNTNGLSGSWNFVDVNTEGEPEYATSIAASRFQTPPNQTAWVLYRHYHPSTNAYDIHYAYTTDGGQNWTFAAWPPTNNMNHGDVRWPWIETSFDYIVDISVGLATTFQSFDSIITAWANAGSPSNWQGRYVINDHDATGEFPNKIDLNITLGGTTVLYRQYGSGYVWFDWWYNVGIKEFSENFSPNYSVISKNGYAILKFSLPYGKNLKIDVFSSSGENVGKYEKYFDAGKNTFKILLPSQGVYFLKLSDRTLKVINVK